MKQNKRKNRKDSTRVLTPQVSMADGKESLVPPSVTFPKETVAGEVDKQFRTIQEENGRYKVGWPGFTMPGAGGLLKFIREGSSASIPNETALGNELPVKKPNFSLLDQEEYNNGLIVYWLGHACVLVQMDGVRFLTDPVFSSRCGPSFGFQVGPTRYREAPCKVTDLPENIDFVVISHNHYDHLDVQSVNEINKHCPDVTWCVPAGVGSWMISTNCKKIIEFKWWEQDSIGDKGVTLTFVPAQHWSKRGARDDNKTLWGGWCVKGSTHNFYFAGDTGYPKSPKEIKAIEEGREPSEKLLEDAARDSEAPELFKEIGQVLGPFDLAAIPIGAYKPRWFMHCQHVNPDEALKIHQDVGAKKSIGIHWGTFNLSREDCLEPRKRIKELQKEKDYGFFTINPGEHAVLD